MVEGFKLLLQLSHLQSVLQGTHKFLSPFLLWVSGDTAGSFVYVPCEVMKQRMQVQGTRTSWSSVTNNDNFTRKPGVRMYGYYTGIFHAGSSIWKEQGLKGLYTGYICIFCPT